MRILTCSLILIFATVVHTEASLTGKWQGATTSGTEIILDLTATDTSLTGSLTRKGETVPISDGKVSKKTFTFKASINDQTEAFTGTLTGDELKVWLDRQGPERAALLKRVTK
jgi:hypothetical protein